MRRPNPTQFAILGLLAEEPRSGYDIKKEVEQRLAHFWSESYGHIYPMLKRLHEQDMVSREVERQDGRPDRHVYALTDDGRRALADWFEEPPSAPRPRNEVLLRLFFGRHAPTGTLLRDVRAFHEGMASTLDQLRAVSAMVEGEPEGPDHLWWRLVLDYGLRVVAAAESWGREAEEVLGRAAAAGEVGTPTR